MQMYHLVFGYLLPFALLMGVLVGVHEGGHFAAARLLGIGVTDFAIGMGPTVFSRRDRSGCTWKLCALPIGGYVKMLGDRNPSSSPDGAPAPAEPEPTAARQTRDGTGHERLGNRRQIEECALADGLIFVPESGPIDELEGAIRLVGQRDHGCRGHRRHNHELSCNFS